MPAGSFSLTITAGGGKGFTGHPLVFSVAASVARSEAVKRVPPDRWAKHLSLHFSRSVFGNDRRYLPGK